MKRYLTFLLVLALLLSGCAGSYGQVNLQEPIVIPDDGIISEKIVRDDVYTSIHIEEYPNNTNTK